MGKSNSLVLTADDNKLLPNGGKQPTAIKQQNSLVLTADDNQFIKKKEDGQPLDNGSPAPSQLLSQSTSVNTPLQSAVDPTSDAIAKLNGKVLSPQDIQNLPEAQNNPLLQAADNKKIYAAANNVKTSEDVSKDVGNIVSTYYDAVNPINVNKPQNIQIAPPTFSSDNTRANINMPPGAAVDYNNSISKSPVVQTSGELIQANKDAKRKMITGIQQGDPQAIKQFRDLSVKNLQSKVDLIDSNPQGDYGTPQELRKVAPSGREHVATTQKLSPAQIAEKAALQGQIDHITNTLDDYTQIALVDKTAKKPGGLRSTDNIVDLGNNLRAYRGADVPRETLITDATAKTEVNYLNEQTGLNAVRDVKGKQFASYMKDYMATGNPQSQQAAHDVSQQLSDVDNQIATLPDKYAPVRVGYVSRLMGEYISDLHPVANVFITDADRRQAVNNIEKDYPGFSAKYSKEINFINGNGAVETLIPHQGFIGAINRGGVAGVADIVNFGKDFFGIRGTGDRAADEVKNEFDAYMKGTAQGGGGKVVLNKDGLTFAQRDDENYTPTNFNSTVNKVGSFIGGVIPFVASTELGGEGVAAVVGNLNKAADVIKGASEAKRLANLADFGETDVLGYEAAQQAVKSPALSAAKKQFAGNVVGNYVMNFDNNLNIADKLITDDSGAGDSKKALVANLLTFGQIAAFSALPLSAITKKLVSDGLQRDAGKLIVDVGEENILNAGLKDGFKKWASDYVVPRILNTVNTLKQTGATTAKGLSEMVLMNHLNSGIENMFDETGHTKNHNVWDDDLQTIKDAGLGMIGLAGISHVSGGAVKGLLGYFTGEGGVPNVLREAFPLTTRDALYESAGNVDENVQRIRANIENGTIDKDRGNAAISIIRTAGEMYPLVVNAENEGLPKTTKQKAQMLAEMVRGRLLEQADQKQGVPELMQGVNDNLENIQADNRYNQVQPLHNLAGDVVGHEPIGEPLPTDETHPAKVGDEVQWTKDGVEKFEEPKKITAISADGTHVFVEDSNTAIPIHEIENLSSLKTKSNESNDSGIKKSGNEKTVSQSSTETGAQDTNKKEGDGTGESAKGSGVQKVGEPAGGITVTMPKDTGETTSKGGVTVINPTARPSENINVQMPTQVSHPEIIPLKNESTQANEVLQPTEITGTSNQEIPTNTQEAATTESQITEPIKSTQNETTGDTSVNKTDQENVGEQPDTKPEEPSGNSANDVRLEHGNTEQGKANEQNDVLKTGIHAEHPKTILTHKGLQEIATEIGSEDVTPRERESRLAQLKEADNEISDWQQKGTYDKNINDIIDRAKNGHIDEIEQKILANHLATLREERRNIADKTSQEFKDKTKELSDVLQAAKTMRSKAGGLLGDKAFGTSTPRDYTSPTAVQESVEHVTGKPINEAQKKKIDELTAENEALLKHAQDAEKELIEKTDKEINEAVKEGKEKKEGKPKEKVQRKTHEDFVKERQDIAASIKEKWKNAGKGIISSDVPYRKQFAAITPDVFRLTKSLFSEGIDKLGDIVDTIHDYLKDDIIGLRRSDVLDLISGKYAEQKDNQITPSKERDIKRQAQLVRKLEDLQAGLPEENGNSKQLPTPEVKALLDKIAKVKKDLATMGYMKDNTKWLKEPITAEEKNIKRLEKQLEYLQAGKIKDTADKRELSEKEKDLQDQIFDEKKKLGLVSSKIKSIDAADYGLKITAEEKKIERLEKEKADLEQGIVKQKGESNLNPTPGQQAKIDQLNDEIHDLKKDLGVLKSKMPKPEDTLTPEQKKEAQNIKRLESELEDAKNDRLKKKPDSREPSEREKELQAQIKKEKTRIDLDRLQNQFAGKTDNKFTPDEAKAIWDYTKEAYLDNGVPYKDALSFVKNDLGLTWKQVSEAFTSPKLKPISDAMWKKQAELRKNQAATKIWVEKQALNPGLKGLKKVSDLFRGEAVFGHGAIFLGTHAGMTFFQPTTIKHSIRAFFNGYRYAYGNKANYERAMEELKNSPNYTIAQRAGLKNDPERLNNEEYQSSQKYLGKLGGAGERGFNAIKLLRQNLFDYHYEGLSAADKADPKVSESIAHLINNATGATNLKLPTWVNEVSFAGGMEAARWGKLTRNPAKATTTALKTIRSIMGGEPVSAEDRIFAKVWASRVGQQLGTFAGLLAVNAAIQNIANPSNPTNILHPTDPDWLKFKFGDATLDPSSGMVGATNFITGLANIAAKDQKELHGDNRTQAAGKTLISYARGKLAPGAAVLWDLFSHTDFSGNVLPWNDDKPRAGKHQLSVPEYISEKLPLPVAEAFKVAFQSAEDNGHDKVQTGDVLKGILLGALSGGTGFRVGEAHEKHTPFTEEDNKVPAFKYFTDKGLDLPNTSLTSEEVTDEANGTKMKLSDYPKDVQQQYTEAHKQALQQNLSTIIQNGTVYVKSYKDAQGKSVNEVSINQPTDGNYDTTTIDALTPDELTQVLHIAQSKATKQTKKQMFAPKVQEESNY